MRSKKLLICLVFLFVSLFAFGFNAKVNAIETSDLINVEGAQIRTTGNAGIRFVATETYEGETSYGILLAFGEAEADENFVVGGTVNEKAVANAEVATAEGGVFKVTLYDIPEVYFTQAISARAYVVVGGEYVYSSTVCVKSLAEVSLKAKNDGNNGELVNNVIAYLSENYMNVYTENSGNFVVSSSLFETNLAKLEAEFVADWNKKFDTAWTEIDYTNLQASAILGTKPITGTGDADCSGTNLYAFFNEGESAQQWRWLLTFFLNETNTKVHPKRQINAILGDGTNTDSYGSGMNLFRHLAASIANFFNGGCARNGEAGNDIVIEDATIYDNIINYNGKIANYSGIYTVCDNVVKIGSTIILPEIEEKLGSTTLGWFLNETTTLAAGSEYEVTSSTAIFVPSYQANVDMSNIYVSNDAAENFSYGDLTLIYGVNLFKTVAEALEVVEAGNTITLLPGTYSSDINITKKITLTTLNGATNPVNNSEPFTNAETKVEMTGVIYLNANNNTTIQGITFTGAGMIIGAAKADVSGITIKNNYFYNTTDRNFTYTAHADLGKRDSNTVGTVPGTISLSYNGWTKNAKIINNVFSNIGDFAIYANTVNGITISENKFIDISYDAIRLNSTQNYGTETFDGNHFENIRYNAIEIRGTTYPSKAGAGTYNITNNTFKNVAYNETKLFSNVYIGCVATRNYQEFADATFNIKFNNFEDCGGYINVRSNYVTTDESTKPGHIYVNIEYNSFINSSGAATYSATSGSNQKTMTFNNNFYGTDENTKVTPTTSNYDSLSLKSIDTVTYNTVADLKAAIEALN